MSQEDAPRGAKIVGSFDITLTWAFFLPILVAGLVHGNTVAQRQAIEQLERMAEIADDAQIMLVALKTIIANHSKEGLQTHLDGTDLADALAAIAKVEGRS